MRLISFALSFRLIAAQVVIDASLYATLFGENLPMFEAMTEMVVASGAKNILDLGTGPGEPSTLIARAMPGSMVTATDSQLQMIEKAKKRGEGLNNLVHAVASADDLSAYTSASFDAVTMSYVLMFVKNREKSLREIGRVLKKDGVALLSVWKKAPLVSVSAEALGVVTGTVVDSAQLPINPLALESENAVEDLLASSIDSGLSVENSRLLEYPFHLGTAEQTCDTAMILVGSRISSLQMSGFPDAKDDFCKVFIQKLEALGMKTDRGVFKISGMTAQLLTLRKTGREGRSEL
eukprot:TRINITY_DN9375_c0_g2_i1.p1 TRINITY_DN9375_c0_g2~~TRINITY_DN9375_c0_g2_i1.p1  ORF type:complete len:293 (-),score=68.67 TRINITY_DN9375_c0_g2_i1:134-1012(-)